MTMNVDVRIDSRLLDWLGKIHAELEAINGTLGNMTAAIIDSSNTLDRIADVMEAPPSAHVPTSVRVKVGTPQEEN